MFEMKVVGVRRAFMGVLLLGSLAIGAPLLSASAIAADVTAVRVGEHQGYTRVVLDVTGPAAANWAQTPDGTMVMADLPGVAWRAAERREFRNGRLVTGYQTAPLPNGGTRVMIAANRSVGLKNTMTLTPHGGRGNRIVIDLVPANPPMAAAAMVPVAPAGVQTVTIADPAPLVAQAEPMGQSMIAPGSFHASLQGSTLGLGGEVGYRVSPMFGVRGGANFFGINRSFDVDGIEYDASGQLRSVGLVGDLYPFQSGFHLTGGIRLNWNRADISATPTTSVDIGDTTYSTAQIGSLDGDVEFNRVAPYLGIGWKGTLGDPNLIVGADLGVMFQGSPKVSLTSTSPLMTPQLAADLERERQDIEDELKDFRFYPVLGVSVGYRF